MYNKKKGEKGKIRHNGLSDQINVLLNRDAAVYK